MLESTVSPTQPNRPPLSGETVRLEKSPHEFKLERWLERYQAAINRAGTKDDNENFAQERRSGPAYIVFEFTQARADLAHRTPQQYQELQSLMHRLVPGEAQRLIEKATVTDLTLQSLKQLGYQPETIAPEYASEYGVDAYLDLHPADQREWDALPYQGVLLHIDPGHPLLEIPDNQVVFAQPDGAYQQLLSESNIDKARNHARHENSVSNTFLRQEYIDKARFRHKNIWRKLSMGVEAFEQANPEDHRPFAAAMVCLPAPSSFSHLYDQQTGELATYHNPQTGQEQAYLSECLQSSLDNSEAMALHSTAEQEPSRLQA